jgi:hypothetical protein
VNRTGQAVNFGYVPTSNPQQVTFISQGVPLADIHYEDPGAAVESDTFSVTADGNYWVAAERGGANLSDVFARLDNFMVEALQEAPMPSLSLTDNDGNPITSSIEAEPGTPFMLCLSPDSAPAEDMALALSIDGDGSPHFSDFTTMPLTFQAGSTDSICFELSPASDTTTGTYTFKFEHGNDIVMDFQVVVEPCSVAGPDQTICAGESVQLGTGNLTEPTGVDYCYVWEPNDNLITHLSSSMPTAFPTETTTYTVYVTSSQGYVVCVDEVTVNVNSIGIEEWDMPRICPGESVTIAPVILSDGNYSYLWENGATTPTVEVELLHSSDVELLIKDEDTGCEEKFDFFVSVERPPNIEIISSYPEICELEEPPGLRDEDDSPGFRSSNECPQTFTSLYAVPGLPGYSYQWSTGENTDEITVDEAGFYWVTVTKDGETCSATDVYEVGSCATTEIQIGEDVAGNPILDTGGEPGSTYQWQDGSTAQTIGITGLGLYTVTVTNSEGCVAKDGFVVKEYEYDPEDIFLVYYTLWGNDNNLDIYVQHNLQQGQDKTEYQEVIRTEVGGEVANLDQKNIRFFWNKKVEHQADITPVLRNSGKFFPMIIDQWPNTDKLRRFDYFFTPTYEEIPYKVKLDISHQEPNEATPQEAEVILDYATGDDKTIELGQPDFPSGYESLGQYVTAVLSIGKDASDGQSIEFDNPTLTMEIEFKPSVAAPAPAPNGHEYKLYLNGTQSSEDNEIEVGSSVALRIKDETTGIFIKPTNDYTNFTWEEDGVPIPGNFDQDNV